MSHDCGSHLAAHKGSEGAELLGEGQEHLVLIVDGVCQEGDQLAPGALNLKMLSLTKYRLSEIPAHPQSQCDGGELLDAVQPELHVLVPQLVNEDRDRVKGVVASIRGHC